MAAHQWRVVLLGWEEGVPCELPLTRGGTWLGRCSRCGGLKGDESSCREDRDLSYQVLCRGTLERGRLASHVESMWWNDHEENKQWKKAGREGSKRRKKGNEERKKRMKRRNTRKRKYHHLQYWNQSRISQWFRSPTRCPRWISSSLNIA